LIAGILMLVTGILSAAWFMAGSYVPNGGGMMGGNGMMDGFSGMMDGYESMMHGFGVPLGYMSVLSIIGLIAGILVLIGAVMLNARPEDHVTWGAIILSFSVISLLGMGGLYVGALLGIAGGALALSRRPATKT
jgi:hypothetical protein